MILVKLVNLSKKYHQNYILKEVNLDLIRGELVLLTGSNGAGKSTLIKLIIGQINATSGSIIINTKKISYVPEVVVLPSGVKVDVFLKTYFKTFKKGKEVDHYLIKYGIFHHKHKDLDALSKGTRQKISLIMAEVSEPELVILDEAISGLDDESKKMITDFISFELKRNASILVSTHFLDLYKDFKNKRVLRVGDGHLVKLT